MQLQIESTNVCNADCCFCEYGAMSRPKGTMTMPLFRKIVDDAISIPIIDHYTITGLGETLLDRHIVDRIRYIRHKLAGVPIDIYTNGTFLRPEVVDRLIDAGLTTLYISLNAINAEKRKATMKLDDFDVVMEQIRYAIRATEGTGTSVVVKGIVAKDLMECGDQEKFLEMFGGSFDKTKGHAFLHLEGNWAGAIWPMRVVMKEACHRALNQFMVLWDGRVSLCCFDGNGREILGDMNHQSIREVFNSQRATFIREAHYEGRRNEIPICAGCTGI